MPLRLLLPLLPHALIQLGVIAAAYGALLIAEAPDHAVVRWLATIGTLAVAGLLVSRLRTMLQSTLSELVDRAREDPLTGILNRRTLEEFADRELTQARREGVELSVIVADIDAFKLLNDRLGHPAGDDVLRKVAEVLQAETRDIDLVARVGGDEFVALLPGASAHEAEQIAERLRGSVRRELAESGVQVSIGIASAAPPAYPPFDALWGKADAAMYRAKRTRGDSVQATAPAGSGSHA